MKERKILSAMTYMTSVMIIILDIHVVKDSFCSQYSFVSEQYSFMIQRIFQNSYNRPRSDQTIESLYKNTKTSMRSATRFATHSALNHKQ